VTFPTAVEAAIATEEAVRTGLPTWTALTAGPGGDLLPAAALGDAARAVADRGAVIVLVNCVAAARIEPYVDALAATGLRFGVYANAGATADGLGWDADDALAAGRYLVHAKRWLDAGACVVGGCCGTRPAHVRALRVEVDRRYACG
jgi:S-methylmethionine-dependent homocysteine/selenocysteine methylase